MSLSFLLRLIFSISFISYLPLASLEVSSAKIRLIYNSLDQTSVAQHLALYELYPETTIGQQALREALELLGEKKLTQIPNQLLFLRPIVEGIVNLVNKRTDQQLPQISEDALVAIESLAAHLPHKKLPGHSVWEEEDVLLLPSEKIDLARGLFISEMGSEEQAALKIRSYEALLDLMALQIMARVPKNAGPTEKIRAINDFIFFEMGFRFPPHSSSVKDVDLYSFLPSVIDSRKGVCLGVSILYICLAQRMELPLEIITPPGHIFVRYEDKDLVINIETTARGMHLEDEVYLGIETRKLERRTLKETIGMAHFNKAAVYWQQDDHKKTIESYTKAMPYLPEDKTLKELLGYNYLLAGDLEKGHALMEEVKDHLPDYAVSKQTMAEDYLLGKVDVEGIRAVFKFVDENRESIERKRDGLQKTLEKYPFFRAGWFSLAGAWLQLHRLGEALEALKTLHRLDDTDPSVEYYMAEIYTQRNNYQQAWQHLKQTENILKERNHSPKMLKKFRKKLSKLSPEELL